MDLLLKVNVQFLALLLHWTDIYIYIIYIF